MERQAKWSYSCGGRHPHREIDRSDCRFTNGRLAVILFAGIAYFASHQSYQECVALLSDKLASDEAMPAKAKINWQRSTVNRAIRTDYTRTTTRLRLWHTRK
jgi:hypothetical protein